MKILWASPLPPIPSGVSDYAVELLSELSDLARIRVVRPPSWEPPSDWSLDGAVELVATGVRPEDDETTLVHLGNNLHHDWLVDRLGDRNAVVVLHDLVLHHLLVERTVDNGRVDDLDRHLVDAHGEAGGVLARARAFGFSGTREAFLFPARQAFLNGVRAAIVHSRWAEDLLEREFPAMRIGRIDLPAADPGRVDRSAERAQLGFADEDVVVMHLGFLTAEKGVGAVLEGLAAAVALDVPVKLVLVGQGEGLDEILGAAVRAGIGDRVQATGFLALEDFVRIPAAADVGVVLRAPSAGETSAAAVRFLACGTPVAVVGLRQFLEWPEPAAPRITPGPSASADLARLLRQIALDRNGWKGRRQAAREVYETSHRPRKIAEDLTGLLERFS